MDRTPVSAHFTRGELLRGSGVDTWDDIPPAHRANLVRVCEAADVLRDALGILEVVSGYRTAAANKAAKGEKASQHLLGRALDLRPYGDRARCLDLYYLADAMQRDGRLPRGGLALYSIDDARDRKDHGRARFVHIDVRGHLSRWKKDHLERAQVWAARRSAQ